MLLRLMTVIQVSKLRILIFGQMAGIALGTVFVLDAYTRRSKRTT